MKQLLLLLFLLATTARAHAQGSNTDVILRTDGTEVSGRVVTITPLELRYLPPASADTLRLASADVFLVRYANGTREVLHPVALASPEAAETTDLLPGLSDVQRCAKARQDADRYYTDHAPFWSTLGATLYAGPLVGLIAPAIIAPHAVSASRLHAPHPELLADPAYGPAYRKEAHRRKRGRAWGGYAMGATAWALLIGSIVASGQ